MSKQKITPGEWQAHKHPDGATHIILRNSARTESNIIAHDVLEHNAQAIAAVPDMIEAFRRICGITYKHDPTAAIELAKETAKAALRKAGQID